MAGTHRGQLQTPPEMAADPDPAGHLGAELLGGALGLGAAAGLGLGVAWIGMQAGCPSSGSDDCGLPWLVLGATAGGVAAVTLMSAGVGLAGSLTGGRGAYWAALLGGAAGAAVGWLVGGAALQNLDIALAGSLGMGLAGATLGYRWSAPRESAFVALPVVTSDGATLRLAGAF